LRKGPGRIDFALTSRARIKDRVSGYDGRDSLRGWYSHMLRTRLWMGACLIALAAAMLVGDRHNGPWYPFLLLFIAVIGGGATVELLHLLPPEIRPARLPSIVAVLAILAANWPAHVGYAWFGSPLETVLSVFAAAVLGAFLIEMAHFREPGGSVVRIAVGVWVMTYLGLLPSFLAQLRWSGTIEESSPDRGAYAIGLAIFIPKICDIGAYFTGRFLGKHAITPVLSPKKTAEGFVGGLVLSALSAWLVNRQVPLLGSDLAALGFGLTVGLAGIYGDLAESLIKRDCRQKDASSVIPGFGGVLDVIDSIVFAAPVAYWWLR
jgi:phosphatidate cytidylyltransferase